MIIIILNNHIQKKRTDMSLVVGQCLQDVHLIKKKINLIITRCSFDKKENKLNYYRGKDFIEKTII